MGATKVVDDGVLSSDDWILWQFEGEGEEWVGEGGRGLELGTWRYRDGFFGRLYKKVGIMPSVASRFPFP